MQELQRSVLYLIIKIFQEYTNIILMKDWKQAQLGIQILFLLGRG